MKSVTTIKLTMRDKRGLYGRTIPSKTPKTKHRGPKVTRIIISLSQHAKAAKMQHRGLLWLQERILRTIDHEFSHVFEPPYATSDKWERQAEKFEQAGAWARYQ